MRGPAEARSGWRVTVYRVRVCGGPRCAEQSSERLLVAFHEAVAAQGLDGRATVSRIVGVCHGKCRFGPNVFVSPGEVWYCGVRLADVPTIVAEHLGAGQPVERLIGAEPAFLQLDDRLPW